MSNIFYKIYAKASAYNFNFRNHWFVFATYFFLYFLYFLRLPLNGMFTGNSDIIGCLALFQEDLNSIKAFFTGQPFTSSFYMEHGLAQYTEPYYGELILYLLFKFVGLGTLWAQNLLQVTLFSLNAFSFYYFLKNLWYEFPLTVLFLAGLTFSASTFAFSNLDLYNGNCYFPCLFALAFLLKFLQSGRQFFLALMASMVAGSVYFSGYIFLYSHFILFFFFLLYFKSIIRQVQLKGLIVALITYVILLAPYLNIYLLKNQLVESVSPLDGIQNHEVLLNLKIKDFFHSYPHNIIYTNSWLDGIVGHDVSMYHANLGLTFYIICALGLWSSALERKVKIVLIAMAFSALTLSFGQHLDLFGKHIKLPTAYFYDNGFIRSYIRIPGRIYGIYCLALFIIGAFGLKYLHTRKKYYPFIVAVLFLVENVPYKLNATDAMPIIKPDKTYIELLAGSESNAVVMDLPSCLPQQRIVTVNGINQFTREYRYSYWQTLYLRNCINGTSGVWPVVRLRDDTLMRQLNKDEALNTLIVRNRLTHVVFHKDLLIFKNEKNIQTFLDSNERIYKIYECPTVILYRVKK